MLRNILLGLILLAVGAPAYAAIVGRNVGTCVARADSTHRLSTCADGIDGGSTPTPEAPILSQPVPLSATTASIGLAVPCVLGTPPYFYQLQRSTSPTSGFAQIAYSTTVFTGSYSDSGLSQSTDYYYRAKCDDSSAPSRASPYSVTVNVTTPSSVADTTAPSVPASCVASLVTQNSATLTCQASTDAVGVVGYTCTQGDGTGSDVVASPSNSVTFSQGNTSVCNFINLKANQNKYLRMAAFDLAGNVSASSTRVWINTLPLTPPVLGQAVASSPTSITVTLTADALGGASPYTSSIRRCLTASVPCATIVGTAFVESVFTDTTVSASTTYYYSLIQTDSNSVATLSSNVASATTPAVSADVVAPNCSASVTTATAATTVGATFTVTGCTDNVGVVAYDCVWGYGDGNGNPTTGPFTIVRQASNSFTVTTAISGSEIYGRCNAVDAANLVSGLASPRAFIDTLGSSTPGTATIVFRDTFEGYPVGNAQTISGAIPGYPSTGVIWTRNNNGTSNATTRIESSNPVASGFGKHLTTHAQKLNLDIFRTEYGYNAYPYHNAITSLGTIGGVAGQGVGPIRWYGVVWCLQSYTATDPVSRTHYWQWHDDEPGEWSPMFSLTVNATDARVYMEQNQDGGGNVSQVVALSPVGKCYNLIWQIRVDTRLASQGSTGILRAWVYERGVTNPVPNFEWVNKQVASPAGRDCTGSGCAYNYNNAYGGNGLTPLAEPYVQIGGYHSSWRWSGTNGQTADATFDNFTVMDSTGSYEAMLAALNAPGAYTP